MKKRTYSIIRRLLREERFISSRELGGELGLSKRMLLSVLDDADELLVGAGLSRVERVPNRGVRLVPSEREAIGAALEARPSFDDVINVSDAADRRFFLLFVFLFIDARATTDLLAHQLQTSVRTVSNDIRILRGELGGQGISLAYDKRQGYQVQGSTFAIRNYVVGELRRSCPMDSTRDVALVLQGLYQLAACVPPFTLTGLGELFRLLDDVLGGLFERDVCRTVLLHLVSMAAEREPLTSDPFSEADRAYLEKSANYELARFIRMQAQGILGVELSEEQDYYLVVLLQSMPATTADKDRANYPFELEVAAQKLILSVSETYGCDFRDDDELFRIIVGHLIPLMYRLQFNAQITNPLLGTIVGKYGKLHSAVRVGMVELERLSGMTVSDDECSFFTLYFASSIEKLANARSWHARVLVVCNAGNAVSRLLQYKLINAFNVQVIGTCSEAEVEGVLERERKSGSAVDLVIGVVDVARERLADAPFLRVAPFLGEQDYERLGSYLGKRVFAPVEPGDEPGRGLLELLDPNCFCVLERVGSMDELIEAGGALLCRAGLCDEDYPRQMVSAAHCFGPLTTILIAPGIIMPHAGISEHVLRTGFSFVRLEQPIQVNGQKVFCALSLCTRNKLINQRAIQQVGMLLRGTRFMEGVDKASSWDEFSCLVNYCLAEAEGK